MLMVLTTLLLTGLGLVRGETVGHVTRDYFGDIFTLLDCEPGSCEAGGRRAALIPGEQCRCQCAPSHYTFREDMRQCIKDVGECPVAMFVRPFAVERIPLVFLPMTGQLVYPGAHLTVSGITRLTPSKHLSCNVKTSLLMTSHGWQPIRTPSQIFGVYYDGNKTFLQWLGDDEDRRRLQHHLVLIRLLCEGESSNGTFEPCAALRVGWAPGLETEFAEQPTNKNNFVIIGLCLGILGLIYVGAVLIYLKVRKNRRQTARQSSQATMESAEEPTGTQLRNAYINNLVQEAELTTQKSSPKGMANAGCSSDDNEANDPSNSQAITANGKINPVAKYPRSTDVPNEMLVPEAQAPPQEFFVRIRGMISAAKNRLNSFRYRPTLLVIPEDDYFYQDFKERDKDASGSRKSNSFRKFSRKASDTTWTNKMESIHGSNLGAAMLEAKLAPPLPPPRSVRTKSKKRAPSPPDHTREPATTLKELGGSLDRKKMKMQAKNAENISKFDLFRLDLYDKINRMREVDREEITVLEMINGKRIKADGMNESNFSHSQYMETRENGMKEVCVPKTPQCDQDNKISRRQLLHKLEAENASLPCGEQPKSARGSPYLENYDRESENTMTAKQAGYISEQTVIDESYPVYNSRPGTAMSNSSARTTSSQPSTMKENKIMLSENNTQVEQDDLSEYTESSEESLSGDSLNSSFRKQVKSPSSLKSKRSLRSTEDVSVISGSSVITASTAIKEVEDYDDDDATQDDESHLSTDLDAELYSIDDSEHPSLEEYLQLSSQVAKKLSERTVPAFSSASPKEKNVLSQFMKEFKTTIGRLKTEESNSKSSRTVSPGSDNWTLKREEKRAKVARKVSIFKRNPLKGRKNEEPLVSEDSGKNSFYDINIASETDDTGSYTSSATSSVSGKRTKLRYKNKTPEIVPATKVDVAEKTIIAITNDCTESSSSKRCISPQTKVTIPRVGKAVTPPLPPPKPHLDHLKLTIDSLKKKGKEQIDCSPAIENGIVHEIKEPNTILKSTLHRKSRTPDKFPRAPSIESDSISIANSDMTEDSLNLPGAQSEEENPDISEDENGPIDRCLAQLADSVIQPSDDGSLNRYLSQLGNVLAAREDCPLEQCLNKLANMNANRATKGFNLSQHLPLCTWEHVCHDRASDRSTPTSDRSSTSRGSQESLRKKALTKSKHHHHSNNYKHCNGELIQIMNSHEKGNHLVNGHVQTLLANRNEEFSTCIIVERGLNHGIQKLESTSEEEECGRASSLGSTRELETTVSETTSDPGSSNIERPRKKRPLLRRSKKGLNGTCRQHIQNSRLTKKDCGSLRKNGFQTRNSSATRSTSSDVTVIQLEGDTKHITNVDSSNTFVTLINVDSSDCSNSAEEK